MARKEITIYDIAVALNVSAATVSRGLKDHPSISKKTCEKIKKTAREMGYRSNALASSLRTSKTYTLGVIVPRLNSNFMSKVLAGMEKAAIKEGYHLIIMQSLESEQKETECAQLLFNHRVDGLLVSTSSSSNSIKHFTPFLRKNIPVLFFDRAPMGDHTFSSVAIDNKKAGYEITKHLLQSGSRNLLHITGNSNLLAYRQRLEGFTQALKEFNLPYSARMVIGTNLSVEDGEQTAERILKMAPIPDGIFVANDTCAITIVHSLQQKGIKIPEQIKIAGFNNDPFSAFISPSLTTVNYPGTEMGIKAVQAIINLIITKDPSAITAKIDFELIKRNSTRN